MGFWDNVKKAVAIGGAALFGGSAAIVAYFAAWLVALIALGTTGQWPLFVWLLFGAHAVWLLGRTLIRTYLKEGPLSFLLIAALRVAVDLPALAYFWGINRPLLTALLALGTLLALLYEVAREAMIDLGLSDREIPLEERPPGRGRGSSVCMLVGYLIGLSHIDPLEFNLSLERFISDDKLASAPDIDLAKVKAGAKVDFRLRQKPDGSFEIVAISPAKI